MNKNSPIVVAGAGSIGERHITVLQSLGYHNIWVWRQRNLPMRTVKEDTVNIFHHLEELHRIKPIAAIICTPTAQHVDLALHCAEMGIHLLIEKPLSHTLEKLDELRSSVRDNRLVLQVGYMLRYHPHFIQLKSEIAEKKYGSLLSIQSYWGEYLPHWHPWEDYRESYAAQRKLGGGAALTLSHDLDIANYLAGSPVIRWHTEKNYRAFPALDVESAADFTLAYQNGVTAHCHVNFHEKKASRWYRLVMEHASIAIDYLSNTMTIDPAEAPAETIVLSEFERNQMFEAQATDFLSKIDANNPLPASLRFINESETIIRICS